MYYGTGDPSKWQRLAASLAPDLRGANPFSKYLIRFRNLATDASVAPILDTTLTAFDVDHARDRFHEAMAETDDGYEIVSVERLPRSTRTRPVMFIVCHTCGQRPATTESGGEPACAACKQSGLNHGHYNEAVEGRV